MALVETLALTVGPAIAKTILKSWLKDSDIMASASASLMDLLAAKTKDGIAQKRGGRQLEEIGEKVAESLLPLFKEAGLEKDSQTAVALAVANTLNKTAIDPQLLAKTDLEPSELAAFLLTANRSEIHHFDTTETTLYERIITEAANDIVDIASQLPQFTEHTFAEVLKRESQLITVANQTLEEVRRIREESQRANPAAAAAAFEEEYLRAINRKLDEIELFGAEVATASRRHRLSVAYVSLSVEKKVSEQDEPDDTEALGLVQTADQIEDSLEDDEANQIIVSVEEALAESRCMIFRGGAGSGKTTLLKWIAVQGASRSFESGLKHWNNTIPFFIRLRQCVDKGLPAPEAFPALVVPAIAGTMPDGWVHS